MEFDFSFYFKEYFLFPVIMVIFSTTLLVGALFKVLIAFRKSGGQLFCGKPKGVLQSHAWEAQPVHFYPEPYQGLLSYNI